MLAKPVLCRAHVAAVRGLTPQILEADLAMVEPPALDFEAGQWVSVPFGPKSVRAYSIASTPRSSARITLCADVAPGGLGSRWFRGLAPGDEVAFKGPLGGFVLGRAETRRPLFVAEEIGIVPIRAIVTDLHETGDRRPLTLVYWARDPGWLVYDAELRALARSHPGFAYHPLAGGAGEAGVEAAAGVDRLVTDTSGLVTYVAGGEATINRVREALMTKGLERKAVKWEKFW
jgi:propane monooxygenase reductase subunit